MRKITIEVEKCDDCPLGYISKFKDRRCVLNRGLPLGYKGIENGFPVDCPLEETDSNEKEIA